jgi:hypothetical protein
VSLRSLSTSFLRLFYFITSPYMFQRDKHSGIINQITYSNRFTNWSFSNDLFFNRHCDRSTIWKKLNFKLKIFHSQYSKTRRNHNRLLQSFSNVWEKNLSSWFMIYGDENVFGERNGKKIKDFSLQSLNLRVSHF